MILINCVFCKKEIKIFPSRIGRKKYCSHSCRAKDNPSKNFVKDHKWFGKLRTKKRVASNGKYIEIYSPEHPNKNCRNAVLEHRLVMEKKLNRYLFPSEVVHHINHNSKDNRIENLLLCKDQIQHTRIHFLEDAKNNKITPKNTSGFRGVSLTNNKKRWAAKVSHSSGHTHIGVYDTKEEAFQAYSEAVKALTKCG